MRIPFSLSLVAALLACTSAAAQPPDLSARKLTMIVGFAPGGGVDTLARVVAQEMSDQGQASSRGEVVVELLDLDRTHPRILPNSCNSLPPADTRRVKVYRGEVTDSGLFH